MLNQQQSLLLSSVMNVVNGKNYLINDKDIAELKNSAYLYIKFKIK